MVQGCAGGGGNAVRCTRIAYDLNEGGAKALRTYKVWGKEPLDASEWEYPTNALHRFFRVTVEMP